MKIDFHTHGKLAKKLPFSKEYTNWLLKEARFAGLDAICLTEHFNTQGFGEVYSHMDATFGKDGDTYVTEEGLRIFPGMEVDIKEGGHTLVLGKMEEILLLNQQLEPYKEKHNFLPLQELLLLLEGRGFLFGAAHPYREGSNIPTLPKTLLERFDFLDMNGKDMAIGSNENRRKLQGLSLELQRRIVAGSDTHQSFQFGCIYNEFAKECNTIDDLKTELLLGNYEIIQSPFIITQVKSAGILKKSLKQIHALGGNYVELLMEGESPHDF